MTTMTTNPPPVQDPAAPDAPSSQKEEVRAKCPYLAPDHLARERVQTVQGCGNLETLTLLAPVIVDQQPAGAAQPKRSPSDFLKSVMGRPIRVKLNSGIEYRGVLACLDGYLNMAMEQTEEYSDGQLKARLGDCFIRGNNGAFVTPTVEDCVSSLRSLFSEPVACLASLVRINADQEALALTTPPICHDTRHGLD